MTQDYLPDLACEAGETKVQDAYGGSTKLRDIARQIYETEKDQKKSESEESLESFGDLVDLMSQ